MNERNPRLTQSLHFFPQIIGWHTYCHTRLAWEIALDFFDDKCDSFTLQLKDAVAIFSCDLETKCVAIELLLFECRERKPRRRISRPFFPPFEKTTLGPVSTLTCAEARFIPALPATILCHPAH